MNNPHIDRVREFMLEGGDEPAALAALDALADDLDAAIREREEALEMVRSLVVVNEEAEAAEARVMELEMALRNIDVGFALTAHEMRDIARAALAAAPADTEGSGRG